MSDYTGIARVFSITPDLMAEAKAIVDIVSSGVSPTAARLLTASHTFNPVSDRVPVKKSRNTAGGAFSGLDPFNTTQQDTRTYARFEPRAVYQNVTLAGLERDINAAGGRLAVEYEAAEMSEGANDFAVTISEQMWSTGDTYTTGKDIIGLGLGIDSAGTYAGISRTTYSTWGSSEYDITAAGHSASIANSDNGFNLLRRMIYGGTDGSSNTITRTLYGSQKPTVIVLPLNLYSAYEALYQMVTVNGTGLQISNALRAAYDPRVSRGSFNRFTSKTWQEALAGYAGFECIYYSGIPMIWDEYAPSGQITLINENVVQWAGVPSQEEGAVNYDLLKGPVRLDGPNTNVDASLGVSWLGMKKSFNQYGQAGQFILHGALEVKNPRFCGKVTGVTV